MQISEILLIHWPGCEWTIIDDDYSTLEWAMVNHRPKPTEDEIRAFSRGDSETSG